MNIESISTKDLQAELERRKKELKPEKPVLFANPDFGPLQKICQQYIDALAERGDVDDDLDHYIFEVAMETIFGRDVWRFINGHH